MAIFGPAAFNVTTPQVVDKVMERVIQAGVNLIDLAIRESLAEKILGPSLEREGDRFFIGCSAQKREKKEAAAELHRPLELLRTDKSDFLEIHAVANVRELDQMTGPGGALEATIIARCATG